MAYEGMAEAPEISKNDDVMYNAENGFSIPERSSLPLTIRVDDSDVKYEYCLK